MHNNSHIINSVPLRSHHAGQKKLSTKETTNLASNLLRPAAELSTQQLSSGNSQDDGVQFWYKNCRCCFSNYSCVIRQRRHCQADDSPYYSCVIIVQEFTCQDIT